MNEIRKYPRTPHLGGSRLQPGDEDMPKIAFSELFGQHCVVEEKVDGANSGIRFGPDGKLLLQSRGHYLSGGPREWQFDRFKSWGHAHAHEFYSVLGERYVIYGEWVQVKHTIFYNALPNYFLEFDILDLEKDHFLDTIRRRKLLQKLPFVHSVPTLFEGELKNANHLRSLAGPSHYIKGNHIQILREKAVQEGHNADLVLHQTDSTSQMEGLYVKVEKEGIVTERYKWVRKSFSQTVESSGSHWMDRKKMINLVEGE
jgi:hypothetical protein